MNKLSKVLCFTLFSVLLTSGFPNFMMQEAHADNVSTIQLTTTTTVVVTFDANINTEGGVNLPGAWTVGGKTPTAVTNVSGGGVNSLTLTMAASDAFATDATPLVVYADPGDNTVIQYQVSTTDIAIAGTNAADNVAPVFSSARVTSNITIEITFSESMDTSDVELDDFTIGGAIRGSDVKAVSTSGSVVTLTTNNYVIRPGESITVSFDGEADDVEDLAAAANDLADFTNESVTNGLTPTGSCNGDCTSPTLGIDDYGKRLVSNGFTYNGHSVDVERFFTPYPLITANVGKTNTAQFKIYENGGTGNIKHFSLGFGLAKGEVISESKAMIEWDKSFDGKETVTITDPQNALDNIVVNTSVVSCMPDSFDQCLEIEIIHRFRESLDFDIVATDVWDNSRNAWQNYYNHGIHVTGDSLNPPKEYDAVHNGKIFHLTQVDKVTAIDENGEYWTVYNGQWSKNYVKPEPRIDEPVNVMTRNHSQFNQNIQKEIEIATEKLLEICPIC